MAVDPNVIAWSMIFWLVISLTVSVEQCIFYTTSNHKAPGATISESFPIKDYYNDCEFTCYTNPSRCIAANVVPEGDGTYLCQFVSVVVPREHISALEPNPGGKYIYRSAVFLSDVNLTTRDTTMKCKNSSQLYKEFACENILDGKPDTEWSALKNDTNPWVEIDFFTSYLIIEVVLNLRCANLPDAVGKIRLCNRDGSFNKTTYISCPASGCGGLPQVRMNVSVITDLVKIEMAEKCDRKGAPGFTDIEIHALMP